MTEDKKKTSFKDQIKMDTQELCEAAIKNGWIAALISLGITLVFSSIGFFTQSDNETLNYFLDPWLLVCCSHGDHGLLYLQKIKNSSNTDVLLLCVIKVYSVV